MDTALSLLMVLYFGDFTRMVEWSPRFGYWADFTGGGVFIFWGLDGLAGCQARACGDWAAALDGQFFAGNFPGRMSTITNYVDSWWYYLSLGTNSCERENFRVMEHLHLFNFFRAVILLFVPLSVLMLNWWFFVPADLVLVSMAHYVQVIFKLP